MWKQDRPFYPFGVKFNIPIRCLRYIPICLLFITKPKLVIYWWSHTIAWKISLARWCNNNTTHSIPNDILQAWQLWAEEKCGELADYAMNNSFPVYEVVRCVHVGLLCVQDLSNDRPTMESIVYMLGNKYPGLPSPRQPAFTSETKATLHSLRNQMNWPWVHLKQDECSASSCKRLAWR